MGNFKGMKRAVKIFVFLIFCSKIFGICLEECIKLAIMNNTEIFLAGQDLEIAKSKLNQAKTVNFPKLQLGAYYNRYNLNYPAIFSSAIGAFNLEENSQFLYGTRIVLTQPLYTGGKNKTLIKQAEQNLLSAKSVYLTMKNRLIYNVRKSYVDVIYLKKKHNILKNAISQIEKIKGKGKESILYKNTKQLHEIEIKLTDAIFKLNSIVATEFIDIEKIENTLEVPEENFLEEDVQKYIVIALEKRPEFSGLRAREFIDSLSVELGKNFRFPNIDLFSTYDYLKPSQGGWLSNFQVGMSLSIPLFDGGARWQQLKEKNALFKKTKALVGSKEEEIKREVMQALRKLKLSQKFYELARKQKEEFSMPVKAIPKDIERWKEANFDILDAERKFILAKFYLSYVTGEDIEKY